MATHEEDDLGTIDRARELLGQAEQLELTADPNKIALLTAKAQAHALIAVSQQLKDIAIQIDDAQILQSLKSP